MSTVSIVFNGLLTGATGYALYSIPPADNPYAFSACALGFCHGLLGIIKCFKGDDDNCNKVKQISTAMMEIVPLPLINIQLYLGSSQSNSLAMGHGLFIIPLAFDLIAKLFTEEGEDSSTETLKDLTVMGNVVSLVFLGINEGNYVYSGAAFSIFMAKYGALIMEGIAEGSGENTTLACDAIFFYLVAVALGSGSS